MQFGKKRITATDSWVRIFSLILQWGTNMKYDACFHCWTSLWSNHLFSDSEPFTQHPLFSSILAASKIGSCILLPDPTAICTLFSSLPPAQAIFVGLNANDEVVVKAAIPCHHCCFPHLQHLLIQYFSRIFHIFYLIYLQNVVGRVQKVGKTENKI